MAELAVNQRYEENQRRARLGGLTVLAIVLILGLLPLLTYPDPPPGQEGILVNLGVPDQGEGFENAPPSSAQEPVSQPEETTPPPQPDPQPQEQPIVETPAPEREVITTEDPEAIALRKKQQEEARKKREQERQEEARRQAEEAERERQRQEAEAQARREAEANNLKDQLGGLFGSGDGKGNTGTAGNQGDPGGDPDASRVEGITTGSGQVGDGLGGRGILRSPAVSDNSQKTGRIVLRVCVDASGKVISADFTQRGSTSTDSQLISIAKRNAQAWRFSEGTADRQCGTITYDFKVR